MGSCDHRLLLELALFDTLPCLSDVVVRVSVAHILVLDDSVFLPTDLHSVQRSVLHATCLLLARRQASDLFLKDLFLNMDFLSDLLDYLLGQRGLLERHTIWVAHLYGLFQCVFLGVDRETLPLSVDAVDRATREVASVHPDTPISRIFSPLRWVLFYHFKNLQDLSERKLGPAKADLWRRCHCGAHVVDCGHQLALLD